MYKSALVALNMTYRSDYKGPGLAPHPKIRNKQEKIDALVESADKDDGEGRRQSEKHPKHLCPTHLPIRRWRRDSLAACHSQPCCAIKLRKGRGLLPKAFALPTTRTEEEEKRKLTHDLGKLPHRPLVSFLTLDQQRCMSSGTPSPPLCASSLW